MAEIQKVSNQTPIAAGDLIEIIDTKHDQYNKQGRVIIANSMGLYLVRIGDEEFGFIDTQIKKVSSR